MSREEFYAEVPPIQREDIPLVAPAVFRARMAEDGDGGPIDVAVCLLLRGMGDDLALRFRIVQCYAMVSEALRPRIIGYSEWPDLDFEERIAFAADCLREELCESLTSL